MQTERRNFKYLDLIMVLFVTDLLVSNLLSSAKLIDLGTSIGPIALAFDAGTIIFPFDYIFNDILTEVYGYKRSRRVIWSGFAAMALMGFFVWLAGILPGEAIWQQTVGQGAYDAVLGGITGLVVASLTAYFVGEFSNSFVLARMKIWTSGRWVWTRTIGSTLVGEAVELDHLLRAGDRARRLSRRTARLADCDQLHPQSRHRSRHDSHHPARDPLAQARRERGLLRLSHRLQPVSAGCLARLMASRSDRASAAGSSA